MNLIFGNKHYKKLFSISYIVELPSKKKSDLRLLSVIQYLFNLDLNRIWYLLKVKSFIARLI